MGVSTQKLCLIKAQGAAAAAGDFLVKMLLGGHILASSSSLMEIAFGIKKFSHRSPVYFVSQLSFFKEPFLLLAVQVLS